MEQLKDLSLIPIFENLEHIRDQMSLMQRNVSESTGQNMKILQQSRINVHEGSNHNKEIQIRCSKLKTSLNELVAFFMKTEKEESKDLEFLVQEKAIIDEELRTLRENRALLDTKISQSKESLVTFSENLQKAREDVSNAQGVVNRLEEKKREARRSQPVRAIAFGLIGSFLGPVGAFAGAAMSAAVSEQEISSWRDRVRSAEANCRDLEERLKKKERYLEEFKKEKMVLEREEDKQKIRISENENKNINCKKSIEMSSSALKIIREICNPVNTLEGTANVLELEAKNVCYLESLINTFMEIVKKTRVFICFLPPSFHHGYKNQLQELEDQFLLEAIGINPKRAIEEEDESSSSIKKVKPSSNLYC